MVQWDADEEAEAGWYRTGAYGHFMLRCHEFVSDHSCLRLLTMLRRNFMGCWLCRSWCADGRCAQGNSDSEILERVAKEDDEVRPDLALHRTSFKYM